MKPPRTPFALWHNVHIGRRSVERRLWRLHAFVQGMSGAELDLLAGDIELFCRDCEGVAAAMRRTVQVRRQVAVMMTGTGRTPQEAEAFRRKALELLTGIYGPHSDRWPEDVRHLMEGAGR